MPPEFPTPSYPNALAAFIAQDQARDVPPGHPEFLLRANAGDYNLPVGELKALLADLIAAYEALGQTDMLSVLTNLEIRLTAVEGGGGGGSLTIQDEGTPLAGDPHDTLNFVGDGVNAADVGGVATITIPGGGGGGGSGPDEFIVKSADEVRTNINVVAPDSELKFNVAPGDKWFGLVTGRFIADSVLISPRFTMNVGSGTPDVAYFLAPSSFAPASVQAFGVEVIGGFSTSGGITFRFVLDNTNGDVTEVAFEWAQAQSDPGNTTILKGTTLIAWKQ